MTSALREGLHTHLSHLSHSPRSALGAWCVRACVRTPKLKSFARKFKDDIILKQEPGNTKNGWWVSTVVWLRPFTLPPPFSFFIFLAPRSC